MSHFHPQYLNDRDSRLGYNTRNLQNQFNNKNTHFNTQNTEFNTQDNHNTQKAKDQTDSDTKAAAVMRPLDERKGLNQPIMGHWTYLNWVLFLTVLNIAAIGYLGAKVLQTEETLYKAVNLDSCRTADIVDDLAIEFSKLKNSLKEDAISKDQDLAANFRKSLQVLNNAVSKQIDENNKQIDFWGTKISNLQSTIRNLHQSTKENTIIAAHCKHQQPELYDEKIEGSLKDIFSRV